MTVQHKLFQSELSEKKIRRKFNGLVKQYHNFCEKYGYSSWISNSLINFLHQKGFKTNKDLIRDDSNYYLIYQKYTFNLESLLYVFRISNSKEI